MSNSRSNSGSGGRGGVDHIELIPYRPERWWPVQLALMVWRWAVEIALTLFLVLAVVKVHHVSGRGWSFSLLAVLLFQAWLLAVLTLWQRSRGLVPGVFWCLVTRHRLRTWFIQARVFNRRGRLPWIVFIRPTPVGERVWVWLVPGLSVENFAKSTENLTAAAWARTVRIERSRKVGSLVRVDVVRRDPLLVATVASVLIPTRRTRDDVAQAVVPEGPLDVPSTPVTLTGPGAPVWGTPVKKTGANRSTKNGTSGKAALSSQDGEVIPSTPSVITRGGEDVSDYV